MGQHNGQRQLLHIVRFVRLKTEAVNTDDYFSSVILFGYEKPNNRLIGIGIFTHLEIISIIAIVWQTKIMSNKSSL